MGAAFDVDLRLLISPPFMTCPACTAPEFGILTVHEHSFDRRCRSCFHDERYELPLLRKAVIYLDQLVVSNIVLVRQKNSKAKAFYKALYEKLGRLLKLQAIVCPYSEAHILESDVHCDPKGLRECYRALAHGVSFESFDDIRHVQVMRRLERWLGNDPSPIAIDRHDVLRGQPVDIWTDTFDISVELPPIPGMTDKIRAWRIQSHRGLVDVFTNTWKIEPSQTWKYWRDREARSWGRLMIAIYRREVQRWADILEGRVQALPHETKPHHFVILVRDIMDRVAEAGCPPRHSHETALRFLMEATGDTPFRSIAGSIYACLAKKAGSQVKPPTQGFNNDLDVMSCILPYCDAMFMDNEMAAYWREIQGTTARRLPFQTRVFSLYTQDRFLEFLDDLEQAVPDEQRRIAENIYL